LKKKYVSRRPLKPVENEDKFDFHWNKGKLLKKFTIRYQMKEFLQYSVPEIQKEFDKKRKLDEIACDNQKKNNQIKKVKKAKHSNENVKLEKTNSSATVLKGIPRCDLTVEEGKPKWDEIPIDKPENSSRNVIFAFREKCHDLTRYS
jgi:hypothetical protein